MPVEKKKLKFEPVITRVKLNPEQAVLQCSCYDFGVKVVLVSATGGTSQFTSDIFCGAAKGPYVGSMVGGTQIHDKSDSVAFS